MAKCSDKKPERLTKEKWLTEALLALSQDPAHLRVDEIAKRLGVSKGSFYWHFEGRADFIKALAEYWAETGSVAIAVKVQELQGTPEERLRALMDMLVEAQPGRFDLPIRAWARIEPDIMPIVERVDQLRFDTVREIFAEMGFEEPDLGARVRAFVTLHAFDNFWTVALSKKESKKQQDARFEMFTRR